MEMKINIPEWKCKSFLGLNGFVVEEVTAFFDVNENPYNNNNNNNNNNVDVKNLKAIKIKIAYLEYGRPAELKKQYPMLEVLQDFEYSKVANNLFNSILWDLVTQRKY